MGTKEKQYKSIEEHFDRIRTQNHREERRRKEEVYERIPEYQSLTRETSSIAMDELRLRLSGPEATSGTSRAAFEKRLREIREKKINLLRANGFPADYLDPIYTCPLCLDTGFVEDKPCSCFIEQLEGLYLGQSRLKALLEKENFSTLRLDLYQGRDLEWFQKAANEAQTFVRDFSSNYRNLLFFGTVGTGKSFLSHCIAGELIRKGFSVYCFGAVEFFDLLADHHYGRRKDPLEKENITSCDLLILDDLGSEITNQFCSSSLFDLLNQRNSQHLPMIISTNLNLPELQKRYSDRIFTRIVSWFSLLELSGEDLRIKLLEEKNSLGQKAESIRA